MPCEELKWTDMFTIAENRYITALGKVCNCHLHSIRSTLSELGLRFLVVHPARDAYSHASESVVPISV